MSYSAPRRILVTGATGQDGSYLVERLLAAGDEVHALVVPGQLPVSPAGEADLDGDRDGHGATEPIWHHGDLGSPHAVARVVAEVAPEEIYHLGAVSSVADSWRDPMKTTQVNVVGTQALFDAAMAFQTVTGIEIRLLFASSSEVFGNPVIEPQDETTPIAPASPYGVSKAFGQQLAGVYRRRGLGISTAILFNHESPRRPTSFVTRKITSTMAAIARGEATELVLGNLHARRDWGWAPDYVDAMIRANRHEVASEYVVATGITHSVRDFVEAAALAAGVHDWEQRVRIDPKFFRPVDPITLTGDSSRARKQLGWSPTMDFAQVVAAMVTEDLAQISAP